MNSSGKNFIKEWRKTVDFTQEDLALYSGFTRNYIAKIESGSRNPSIKFLESVAGVFNIPVSKLFINPTEHPEITTVPITPSNAIYLGPEDTKVVIPLLADIPAGSWRDWEDAYPPGVADEYVYRYDIKGEYVFAIRVDGPSMEPTLADGDILVLDPELVFMPRRSGRIGVVKFNGGYQVRRVFLLPDGNSYLVKPDNPAFDEEIVPVEGTTVFKIVDRRDGAKKREELF